MGKRSHLEPVLSTLPTQGRISEVSGRPITRSFSINIILYSIQATKQASKKATRPPTHPLTDQAANPTSPAPLEPLNASIPPPCYRRTSTRGRTFPRAPRLAGEPTELPAESLKPPAVWEANETEAQVPGSSCCGFAVVPGKIMTIATSSRDSCLEDWSI